MERYTEVINPKTEGVQSVARALRLLKILSQNDEGLRVSDIARQAGLAVSTTHRLLTTLELQNFSQFEPDRALWHVGREAFAVGSAFGRRHNFVAPALPYLRRLRDLTRETANLGILDHDELVTISQVESREIMRAISPPGGRVPTFCSGMGKAILATWQDADIAAFVARTGFHPMTKRSHRNLTTAMVDIKRIRAQGYALDDEEHVTGLRCLAAVVWSAQGEAACAISVSGLAARLPESRLDAIGKQVADAARELTQKLGGTPPA
ncbi:transcriptional regulator, IclR family [Roseovarius marisflavi]|uniref:Transcriptional regulator, IclR family n=1 Tax=Roseovarius marisflavi TaxID=1054996 RepID=A0A1M6VZB7_9RHOB|nr:IclR family transcriptional regulator [Roseovarius marisflavi]SHK86787.1 transcriptional regulator, IclR family [Roseovarius marisflavi]